MNLAYTSLTVHFCEFSISLNKKKTMKVITAVLIVVAIGIAEAQNPQQEANLKQVRVECADETDFSLDLFTKAIQGDFDDDDDDDEEALKSMLFCIAKLTGLINKSGELQKEVFLEKTVNEIGQAEAERLFSLCGVQQSNPRETAFYALKCYTLYFNNRKTTLF
ncbi:B1 protein [Leptinotarsa decemlineata]|uniref:B1 protein n=1 Tax=Leptinotarsa decemlineata TaxID=7539 RepID=UPI003D30762B